MIEETTAAEPQRNTGLYGRVEVWSTRFAAPSSSNGGQVRALGYLHSQIFGGFADEADLRTILHLAGSFRVAAKLLFWVASKGTGVDPPIKVAIEYAEARKAADVRDTRRRTMAEISAYRRRLDEVRRMSALKPNLAPIVADLESRVREAECRLLPIMS